MLENVLRKDRRVVLGCITIVTTVAALWIIAGAGMDMTAWQMTVPDRVNGMDMNMVMPRRWDLPYAALMFSMWWVMMVAMMLPSATPVILLAATVNRNAAKPPYGPTTAFAAGYLIAWGIFSAAAVALQWVLESHGALTMRLQTVGPELTAALLVAAGVWQFLPLKQACLRHCRSPVDVVTRYRRPGTSGALVMGMRHGAYCLGCCWFLMGLLFVGGVMNLFWIIGIAIFVYVEKTSRFGVRAGQLLGVTLLTAGCVILYRSA